MHLGCSRDLQGVVVCQLVTLELLALWFLRLSQTIFLLGLTYAI